MSDAVIDVRDVSKAFGGLQAVNNCSLQVARGSITGLIGPNGAGKSTLFNLVAGNITPDSGKIIFDGEDITGKPPYELFGLGMLRTFQIAHEFSNMTALENLMMVPGDQPGDVELLRADVGGLLLYTPVVHPREFDSAISYLIRRLDENASKENFLSGVFELADDRRVFAREAERFAASFDALQHSRATDDQPGGAA